MLKDFNEALAHNEQTKSEVVRECIRSYIKNDRDKIRNAKK